MVFHGDIAIALTLIALGVGYLVLVKAQKQESNGTKTAGLIIGWVVIIIAAITLLCASYYSLRYWDDGYYKNPGPMAMMSGRGMMGAGMMSPGMMGRGMRGHGMMSGDMDGQCQQMQNRQMQTMHGKNGRPGSMGQGMQHNNGGPGMMGGMMDSDTTDDQ